MDGDPAARLEHRLRNLLGTIRIQLEVAGSVPGEASARQALAHIEKSADVAEQELRELRAARRAPPPPDSDC